MNYSSSYGSCIIIIIIIIIIIVSSSSSSSNIIIINVYRSFDLHHINNHSLMLY